MGSRETTALPMTSGAMCKNEKETMMNEIFPEPIRNLPVANIPLKGIKAYLSLEVNNPD
ncbi:MAG: hypothetical protein HY755_05620 [Nitrospirae bacterium]|nr:hypothetical protein [Nitrospirota bacterium]